MSVWKGVGESEIGDPRPTPHSKLWGGTVPESRLVEERKGFFLLSVPSGEEDGF